MTLARKQVKQIIQYIHIDKALVINIL